MDDRLEKARARGDGPRAPAFVAFGVVGLGLVGAAAGAALAPWRALAAAGFSLDSTVYGLIAPTLGWVVVGGALGALAGAVGTHLLIDRFQPALRLRIHRSAVRTSGLAPLLAVTLAAGVPPTLLVAPGGRDAPDVLLWAPALALGFGLLCLLPVALLDRAWGRSRWRARVAPDPPLRRRPDEAPPEVRAALAARGRQASEVGDCVLISGDYAAAVSLGERPRLVAHGGHELVDRAHAAGRPVVAAPELATALAGVPTGDALPPALAARIRALTAFMAA